VIDWAGWTPGLSDTTTQPGWVGVAAVALLRDRAGRWHLIDPDVGTAIRLVRGARGAAGGRP
jgi:hypothetical protein